MTTLIVGATGATGRLLVEQLLNRGQHVKIIVRTEESLPKSITQHENVSVICASVLELSDAEMIQHVKGCDAIASCLGHNLSFKGMFGQPRRLVSDAVRRLCSAIKVNPPETPVKFVLMNSSGCSNRDLSEKISFAQKCVIGLLRLLIPPHVDNENAGNYLRTEIAQDNAIVEWAAVRPDALVNENEATEYDIHPSPIRSAIFDSGATSRVNVAHFMAELITDDATWTKWKGQMPLIYNRVQP